MTRIKKSISLKIITAFFLVVLISLAIAGLSFVLIVRNYLTSETRKELLEEGKQIASTLGTIKSVKDVDDEILRKVTKPVLVSKTLNVNFAVIDNDNNVVYSKNNNTNFDIKLIDKSIIERVRKNKETITRAGRRARNFLVEAMPISNNKGEVVAVLILFTPINGLRAVTFSIFRILNISLLISLIIAFIIAYLFAVRISKPINALKQKTEKISQRDFNIQKVVHTGDEIEELDESFNSMAAKIKEYDESQKSFLQNISHELKTPLMSIQGYAEGIKDGVIEGQEVEKSLNIIINEGQRLKKLVDEVIVLTKLESMDEMYSFAEVSINEVVRDAVDRVKSLVLKKDIEIRINEEESIICNADRDKLCQVIINIIGNGVRYAVNQINVTIKSCKGMACIEIENDGPPLSHDEKTNIFKRFYKGKNGGQTGLGMAIANAIVLKHKGVIEIGERGLKGVKFIIKLPYKKV